MFVFAALPRHAPNSGVGARCVMSGAGFFGGRIKVTCVRVGIRFGPLSYGSALNMVSGVGSFHEVRHVY